VLPAMSPAFENVLMIWHSVFCASMSGVNTLTPWITPHKLTPITASQQFDVIPFRDVRPHTKHRSARSFQFSFCLDEISFIDIGEDYFHALTNTPFGYPTSDAARQ
jgi:hypothetical protein